MSTKQSNFFFGSDRNKPKLNLFWLFFSFRTDIKTTETNRILSKQTEKISKKCSQMFFELLFRKNKKKFFPGLFRIFGPISKQTELMVWGIKKVVILTNLLLFRLAFSLFRLFRNTETPCFDIKAKQPKQTS